MAFKRVSVIGLGYIGLPTAAVLASRGIDVVGVDVNQKAVDLINQGKIHIIEPELDVLVRGAVALGRLRAVLTPEESDAFFIAVPTPFSDGHKPDLSYVQAAARSIAPVLHPGNLVVLESTSPVGTTELLRNWLADARPDLRFPVFDWDKHHSSVSPTWDVDLAYCPERVLPGRVVKELVENDRVIGGITDKCARRAAGLYRVFVQGELFVTDSRTAEMCKLAENAFRDVNIAFANELSIICDRLGVDIWRLIRFANRHPRVNILNPGPGVGGHCIAVDPWFIVDSAPDESRLIKSAREINDYKPKYIIEMIKKIACDYEFPTIACLGLSFKPDIDDLRESPALQIVESLVKEKVGEIVVVEPNIDRLPPTLSGLELVEPLDAIRRSTIVVLLVNHRVFYEIDKRLLDGKSVIDTRGIWQ